MTRVVRKAQAVNSLSCAFTGHRLQKLGFGFDEDAESFVKLRNYLHSELMFLIGHNYTHFLSGGAQGFDLIAAEEVLKLRSQLTFVTLELVKPCQNQDAHWPHALRSRYEAVEAAADAVTLISDAYSESCLFERNRFLVDSADMLLALYNGTPGGTKMTVEYARKNGRRTELIDPAIFTV